MWAVHQLAAQLRNYLRRARIKAVREGLSSKHLRGDFVMRSVRFAILIFTALATLTAWAAAAAPEHIEYPWCANYGGGEAGGGGSNCGFSTFEQCLTTLRGMGGFCDPNPFYRPPSQIPARRLHKRHSR